MSNPQLKTRDFLILAILLVVLAGIIGSWLRAETAKAKKQYPNRSIIQIEGQTFRAINAKFYAANNMLYFETTDGMVYWNTKPFLLIEDSGEKSLAIESEEK